MIHLTPNQLKTLKFLRNNSPYKYKDFSQEELEIVEFLVEKKLITKKTKNTLSEDNGLLVKAVPEELSINQEGLAYFVERKKDNNRFLIPLIISIIALIKSFSDEITVAMEQLLKLIKP